MKKNIVKLNIETSEAIDIDVDEMIKFIGGGRLNKFMVMRKLINGETVEKKGHLLYIVFAER